LPDLQVKIHLVGILSMGRKRRQGKKKKRVWENESLERERERERGKIRTTFRPSASLTKAKARPSLQIGGHGVEKMSTCRWCVLGVIRWSGTQGVSAFAE